MRSFWSRASALAFGGVVQARLQRVLGMNFTVVQKHLELSYRFRLGAGIAILFVVLLFLLYAIINPARGQIAESHLDPAHDPSVHA
ncbi:hypothetical protein [Aquisalimonas sp.]|uniref:hypothetical protein n=1 Tax=Aquisalimonas sp. TaxID=1872621 RepID=UPI0025C5A207|nr:hypothetical protein [Aquisalimonas sp.]